jgi:hypothetical protein
MTHCVVGTDVCADAQEFIPRLDTRTHSQFCSLRIGDETKRWKAWGNGHLRVKHETSYTGRACFYSYERWCSSRGKTAGTP